MDGSSLERGLLGKEQPWKKMCFESIQATMLPYPEPKKRREE
jgi:hypothetical protein